MRRLVPPAVVLALCGAATAPPPAIDWQEAVARLAFERTRAETCAGLLKKHGDPAALSRGALSYGEAKAEVDAVVAGLAVAVAQGEGAGSLPDLEARLARGVGGREAFCAAVAPLVPDRAGEKGLVGDLLGGALGLLIEAVKEIVLDGREADRLTRATIRTQLEATAWPAFATVPPSP